MLFRRILHVTNYFFFMANIAIGLLSCLYRIGIGMLFGLLFLGRLDRSVLMKDLERLDTGKYLSYDNYPFNWTILLLQDLSQDFCHTLSLIICRIRLLRYSLATRPYAILLHIRPCLYDNLWLFLVHLTSQIAQLRHSNALKNICTFIKH